MEAENLHRIIDRVAFRCAGRSLAKPRPSRASPTALYRVINGDLASAAFSRDLAPG